MLQQITRLTSDKLQMIVDSPAKVELSKVYNTGFGVVRLELMLDMKVAEELFGLLLE